jgi:hypothetical protein
MYRRFLRSSLGVAPGHGLPAIAGFFSCFCRVLFSLFATNSWQILPELSGKFARTFRQKMPEPRLRRTIQCRY